MNSMLLVFQEDIDVQNRRKKLMGLCEQKQNLSHLKGEQILKSSVENEITCNMHLPVCQTCLMSSFDEANADNLIHMVSSNSVTQW